MNLQIHLILKLQYENVLILKNLQTYTSEFLFVKLNYPLYKNR